MVAHFESFVFFSTPDLHERFHAAFEVQSGGGVGVVVTRLVQGELVTAVQDARAQAGSAPLGFVTESEADALEAIAAGADEAEVLGDSDSESVVGYLSRLRTRAAVRRRSERLDQDFIQAEKLTALGTLVAGVGHELKNPLTTITLGIDILRATLSRSSNNSNVQELLSDIAKSTEILSELVQDLRVFSRNNLVEEPSFFAPRIVIEQALRLVRREFGPNTIVEEDYDSELTSVFLPRNRLAQVLTNLLVNAAHAMQGLARENHQVRVSARADDRNLAISITDTGPGIAQEALDRIFDPFFTTKREGLGTGLGLSISRSIIQQMGGDLAVSSVYGEGATFLCILPLPEEPEPARAASSPPSLSSLPSEKKESRPSLLLIDDDERLLRVASRSLREQFKVLIARDGEEARELLLSGTRADVIVTELDLPELSGPSFYRWLSAYNPKLARKVIISTAAQERKFYDEFLRAANLPVLYKPWNKAQVLEVLNQVLDEHDYSQDSLS